MDLGGAIKASRVIGTTVKNSQNEKLGKVSDLLMDVESGRVVQVILASGGFLGINPNLTAVPPDTLSHEAGQKYFLLDESREKLQAAPKFDAASWNEGAESNAVTEAQVEAGKLMGATVWNLQGEKLGNVKDFIVDLPADRIMAVIISSGGFIGIDGELSAIPPNALRFNGGHDALQLDVSKEALANAPHFKTS
jgi:sporulation protein YlmC with PRC-barrel domain